MAISLSEQPPINLEPTEEDKEKLSEVPILVQPEKRADITIPEPVPMLFDPTKEEQQKSEATPLEPVEREVKYKNPVEEQMNEMQQANMLADPTKRSANTDIRNDVSRLQRIDMNQSEDSLFAEVMSTGSFQEDQVLKDLINSAKGFYTPFDENGKLIPGAIQDGNFIVDRGEYVEFGPTNQNRIRTLVKNGSVVLAHEVLPGTQSDQVIRQQHGTGKYAREYDVVQTPLPQFEQNMNLTGKRVVNGKAMYDDPSLISRVRDFFYLPEDREGKARAKYSNLLIENGIDNPYMINKLLKMHDEGVLKSIEFNERVSDMGRFFANVAIGIANVGLSDDLGPSSDPYGRVLYNATRGNQTPFDTVFDSIEAMTYLAMGSDTILKAEIIDNPEESDKVITGEDGVKRIKVEYFDYAAEKLAENFGISTEQASNILSFNDDALEYLKEIGPEVAAFAAGEAVYTTARGAYLFNTKFVPYMTRKFKTDSYEEAVAKANEQGIFLSSLVEEWAEDDTKFFERSKKLRNILVNRKQDLIGVGADITGSVKSGLAYQSMDEVQAQLLDQIKNATSRPQKAKLRAQFFANETKNRAEFYADRLIPKAMYELAKDEWWAAGGSAATGHFMAVNFGEEYQPVGDLFGALMGVTYLRAGVNLTASTVIKTPVIFPAGRAAIRGLINASKEIIQPGTVGERANRASAAIGEHLKSKHYNLWESMYSELPPEQQARITENIQKFADLEDRLKTTALPDGSPVLDPSYDVPALLADVTALSVLGQMTDYFNSRMLASDIINRAQFGETQMMVLNMREGLSDRIGQAIARLSGVKGLEDRPELNNIVNTLQKMQKEQAEAIKLEKDEFTEIMSTLENNFKAVVSGDILEVGGRSVTARTASNIIEAKQRAILNQYADENGVVPTDKIDRYLAAIENLARQSDARILQQSAEFSEVGSAVTVDMRSEQLVFDVAERKKNDKAIVDSLYEAFRSSHPDARMDGTDYYYLLSRDEEVYKALDSEMGVITVEAGEELSEADKASFLLAGTGLPKKAHRRNFWNAAALEEFRNNPLFVNTLDITDEVTDQELVDRLIGMRETMINETGVLPLDDVDATTPAGLWEWFKRTSMEGDQEKLEAVGLTRVIGERMKMPISISTMQNLTKFLARSADPSTELGKSLINIRKRLIEDSESAEKGFLLDFYGQGTPVGEEVVGKLRTANAAHREFLARYKNRDVATFGIEDASTETKKKPGEVLDQLINGAVSRTKNKAQPQNVISQTLGSDLARILGAPMRRGQFGDDGFFLVEGDQAVEEAASLIKTVAHSRLWLSEPGQEILRLAETGQSLGYDIAEGQLRKLKDVFGNRLPEVVTGQDAAEYITALSRIKVYKVDADGNIDFNNSRPLLSTDELYEPLDITNFYHLEGAKRVGKQKQTTYGQKARQVSAAFKKTIKEVSARMEAREASRQNALSNISDAIKSFTGTGKAASKTVFDLATNTNGMNLLRDARDKHVAYAIEEAGDTLTPLQRAQLKADTVNEFNAEMSALLAREVQTLTRTADGKIDPNKLAGAINNEELMAAMNEFSNGSADILKDLYELSGRVLDRSTGDIRITGFATPYNLDTEINKIWAVTTGRGSLRWWGLQLLVRQGRQLNQLTMRAMLEDPKLGRDLINIIKSGKKPSEQTIVRLYDTVMTYAALDVYRQNAQGEDRVVIPLAKTLKTGAEAAAEAASSFMFSATSGKVDPNVKAHIIPQSYNQRRKEIQSLQGER